MNRVVLLLHPIGCQDILDAGKLVKQPVLEAKHGSWPDNGGFGEYAPDYLLTTRLQIHLETHNDATRWKRLSCNRTLVAKNSHSELGSAL